MYQDNGETSQAVSLFQSPGYPLPANQTINPTFVVDIMPQACQVRLGKFTPVMVVMRIRILDLHRLPYYIGTDLDTDTDPKNKKLSEKKTFYLKSEI